MTILLRLSLILLACDLVGRALTAASGAVCAAYLGAAGVLVAIAWGRSVSQRARLPEAFVIEQVAARLPGAMSASEGDEHIDIHRGGVPS